MNYFSYVIMAIQRLYKEKEQKEPTIWHEHE